MQFQYKPNPELLSLDALVLCFLGKEVFSNIAQLEISMFKWFVEIFPHSIVCSSLRMADDVANDIVERPSTKHTDENGLDPAMDRFG